MKHSREKKIRKHQHQSKPGLEKNMQPRPVFDYPDKKGSDKLKGKIALITGGDSGIGKATAILFAKEGADIAISYLSEQADAKETKSIIEDQYQRQCLLIPGDIRSESNCKKLVKKVITHYKRIDILVNNAAVHYQRKSLEEIRDREMMKTFQTNFFSFFWITKSTLPFLKKGSCIINTASITAYRGSPQLIDYSATKGAIVAFTRSLATNLLEKEIRVNGVAPGPVWTPLIPSTLTPKKTAKHGSTAPMQRSGEPVEIAPSYLFLACDDASYMTGQFLHPNGGEIING